MPSDRVNSEAIKQLQEKGYVVLPEVINAQDCEELIGYFRPWLDSFGEGESYSKGRWILHDYHIGHFESLWRARLKVKGVFASLWGTNKLLTSFDGCSIAPPPETGRLPFRTPGESWLHCDQGVCRRGLHGYQGALYLEETTPDDHCFRVISRSHLLHDEFLSDPDRRRAAYLYFQLTPEHVAWYEAKGCQVTMVPVPKGGMVLWDSRTVHDSLRPREGRAHSDRWRYALFISMEPAIWASPEVIEERRRYYQDMESTGHWATQDIHHFEAEPDPEHDLKELPEVAKSREARLLAGVDLYDFEDGKPNGPDKPELIL